MFTRLRMVTSQYKQVSIMLYTWNKCQLHLNLKNSRENLSVWIQHQFSLASKDRNSSAAPSETAAHQEVYNITSAFSRPLHRTRRSKLKKKNEVEVETSPIFRIYLLCFGKGKKKRTKFPHNPQTHPSLQTEAGNTEFRFPDFKSRFRLAVTRNLGIPGLHFNFAITKWR